MEKSKVLLIAVGCLLIHSCSKNNDRAYTTKPGVVNTHSLLGKKEDKHRPIIIGRVFDDLGYLLPQSGFIAIKGNDTLTGVADSAGIYMVDIPNLGEWDITITHEGYVPVSFSVNAVDSVTEVTDTLHHL